MQPERIALFLRIYDTYIGGGTQRHSNFLCECMCVIRRLLADDDIDYAMCVGAVDIISRAMDIEKNRTQNVSDS